MSKTDNTNGEQNLQEILTQSQDYLNSEQTESFENLFNQQEESVKFNLLTALVTLYLIDQDDLKIRYLLGKVENENRLKLFCFTSMDISDYPNENVAKIFFNNLFKICDEEWEGSIDIGEVAVLFYYHKNRNAFCYAINHESYDRNKKVMVLINVLTSLSGNDISDLKKCKEFMGEFYDNLEIDYALDVIFDDYLFKQDLSENNMNSKHDLRRYLEAFSDKKEILREIIKDSDNTALISYAMSIGACAPTNEISSIEAGFNAINLSDSKRPTKKLRL